MSSVIFHNNNKYHEFTYKLEKDFEDIIRNNSRLLFGSSTIYIDLKPRIKTLSLGGAIPDGILFDLANIDTPEFYLVEAELAKHEFYSHIFPQVTKFIAFYRNPKSQNELIEKVFALIQVDNELKNEISTFLKGKEIFKFIKDTIENSQNILVVIDELKPELVEVTSTYNEWSKMVRTIILKEYRHGENRIITLSPDFENVALGEAPDEKEDHEVGGKNGRIFYTDIYHLEGVDPKISEIYQTIKTGILRYKEGLRENPQKYYISFVHKKNFAFIYIRKKNKDYSNVA
jgi:hypothetical protein